LVISAMFTSVVVTRGRKSAKQKRSKGISEQRQSEWHIWERREQQGAKSYLRPDGDIDGWTWCVEKKGCKQSSKEARTRVESNRGRGERAILSWICRGGV
jgi:hypothetical protein